MKDLEKAIRSNRIVERICFVTFVTEIILAIIAVIVAFILAWHKQYDSNLYLVCILQMLASFALCLISVEIGNRLDKVYKRLLSYYDEYYNE